MGFDTMGDGEPDRDGRPQQGEHTDSRSRESVTSRRAVLNALGVSTAVAVGAGTVQGVTAEPTAAGSETAGPTPPTNLEASPPPAGEGIELSWDGVDEPCRDSLSHYVITRTGDAVETVPAGVTRARVDASASDGQTVYGVSAVDEYGLESEAATVEATAAATTPDARVSLVPGTDMLDVDEIDVGDSVPAELVLRPRAGETVDLEGFSADVWASTPCAVAFTSMGYGDGFTSVEPPAYSSDNDGVVLTAGGFTGEVDDEVVLATILVEGRGVAATELYVENLEVTADGGESIDAANDWTTLPVEAPAEEVPDAPSNLEIRQGISTRADVFWDGVDDPCDPSLSHYSITIDGVEAKTVPIGTESATIRLQADTFTVGVETVDGDGRTSVAATDTFGGLAVADPGTLLRVELPRERIEPGETIEAPIVLSELIGTIPPHFGFEIDVSVSAPCAATITDASYPRAYPIPDDLDLPEDPLEYPELLPYDDDPYVVEPTPPAVADDGSSVTLAVDLFSRGLETADLVIATVELTGQADGHTEIETSVRALDADAPMNVLPRWETLEVDDSPTPPPIGDNENPPQDLDGDGRYRDVNGNGRLDFDDVVTFYQHIDEPAVTAYPDAYDFDGSGELSFKDVIALVERV
ncbi:hypothetical protein [Natronobiforma cellulositropha]|uniref:hypothetical protein n=1 Tax=Natronobiforma cellulositropha TaxID=1679076 RepID=UPI0021D5BBD5|nr:hypothetical protein [Natronobiforma cellulositropha]